jgi:hypothetical protein
VEPTRDDDAVVDLLDVLLRDGAMIQADIIVTVADVPLIGINLRAAVAGMATMREYGFFEDWDAATRTQAVGEQRAATRREKFVPREESGTHGEAQATLASTRPKPPDQSERRRSPPSDRPGGSRRPEESDPWRDEDSKPSGRPHDSKRPGDPDQSSVAERPGGSEQRSLSDRPRGPGESRELDVSTGDEAAADADAMSGEHDDEEAEDAGSDDADGSDDAADAEETDDADDSASDG